MLGRELVVADDLLGELMDDLGGGFAEGGRTVFIRRVGPEGGADHGPARRQRSPRPPDMQGGNVAVPDGFLAPRVGGDALDRQVHFDEAFGVGHPAGDRVKFERSAIRMASLL